VHVQRLVFVRRNPLSNVWSNKAKHFKHTMKNFLIALTLSIASAAAFAHHGWSEYDTGKPITLKGKVEEFGYEHPHSFVRLVTPEKTWLGVLAPPSRMATRGLERDSVKAGDEVTLDGYPSRVNPEEMRAERIIVGGKTVELRR